MIKKKILQFFTIWVDFEGTMLSEIRRKKDTLCGIIYIRNPKTTQKIHINRE